MRAAFVCADRGVPIFGRKGCSVHVQELVRALRREGVAVEIVAAATGGSPPADLADVPVHEPPGLRDAARDGDARRINDAIAGALARIAPLDFVYERYALWSWAGVTHAATCGIPGILEVNAPLVDEHAQHRGAIDVDAARRGTVRAFAAASTLVAVSREVVSDIGRWHAPALARAHVVPNGVDVDRFTPDVTPARPAPGVFTIGFAGSMKPWHGLRILAGAFAAVYRRMADTRMLLVGDGPEAEPARALLSMNGAAGGAQWTGAVDPREVPGLLTSMDVAVAPAMPAAPFYFSPLKVFEYMAAARPVVASRVGQLAEVIEHERTGLLFESGDERSLAGALERLRKDEELRIRLGTAARSRAVERHSWRAVARRILALAEGATPTTDRREVTA